MAFVMLAIFSFSITPKIYLHDLFAGHKDMVAKRLDDGKVIVTKSVFNCECNTLVSTSPFTEQADEIQVATLPEYPSLFVSLSADVNTSSHSSTGLRGPPTVG